MEASSEALAEFANKSPIASAAPAIIKAEQSASLRKETSVRPGPVVRATRVQDTFLKGEMRNSFLGLQICKAGDARTVLGPRANSSPSEDYTEVFLSHTRVYVFAEKFDIQPLKRLALKILQETLSVFWLWPECVNDIVALFRFVYNETSKPVKEIEPMRNMLKLYMSVEISVLSEATGFQNLLADFKDLQEDYCSCVSMIMKHDKIVRKDSANIIW